MEKVMSLLLFGLVHLLVIAAIGAMLVFLWSVVVNNPDVIERLLRVAAFGAGLLAYVGAKALGVSIPELMASALAVVKPLSFGFLGVVFPGLAGTFVAWFCLRLMKKDDNVAARGLVLFSAFFFTMFADTYANLAPQTASSTSVDLMLPNITFVLGVVLYTIFKYKPEATGQAHRGQSLPGMRRSLGDSIQQLKEKLRFKAGPRGEETPEEERQEPTAQHGVNVAQEDRQSSAPKRSDEPVRGGK